MIVGRVIGGLGIGVNTTTIPMFQSETCKPSLRGKLVSVQLTFLVFGFVLTNWMNFGFTYIPHNPVSWRFPLGFQSALAIGTVFLLPMLAESPRWLCLQDRQQEAEVVLSRLVAKPIDDPEVQDLLHVMVTTIARERADGEITWREVFHNGSQQTFRRILLGAGTSFMQQIGGVNIGKVLSSPPHPLRCARLYCLTI
jgi:MFS family permease